MLPENHHGYTTRARQNSSRSHSSAIVCLPHATMLDAKTTMLVIVHRCTRPLPSHIVFSKSSLMHHAEIAMAAPSASFSTLAKPPFTVCTFVFVETFMATPCSNAKSPHSILQWQYHRDLQPRAPRTTTIPARERRPDATSPRQPQTQQHLLRQFCCHRDNHHNLA
ncbi:hypothetical protein DEO72_LG11g1694 [Vigna unguiculata]|uniref:Uncharacterized protein n=1 Tax=Vigna unguiculata TaxID=3917 RepID=A0A4D6NLL1_VIGUN|nr:hypothetical protein DEO72_LG11g1694 [Vigna unguiculata]